jgi:hypothetical protein
VPGQPNTAEPQKPRRRWFQFRLRTLLAVVTICAIAMPWGASAYRDWKERRDKEEPQRTLRELEKIMRTFGVPVRDG